MSRRWVVTATVCGAVVVGAIALALWWPGIPNSEDAEIARTTWQFIRQGHGGFLDDDEARESPGKAIFFGPGAGGNTTILVYEVTTPEDMADVERLALEALGAAPGASRVTLRFYDWRFRPSGADERQARNLLREVSFER